MTKNPMMAPVQNPHIIYRSEPLPEWMRLRLLSLKYAPHVTGLMLKGLPFVDRDIVEYPDGRRIRVKQHKEYDEQGEFVRYRYDIVEELPPAKR